MRGIVALKTFSELLRNTEEQLGRKMQDREVEFMHWVFDRYQEEQKGFKGHATNQ